MKFNNYIQIQRFQYEIVSGHYVIACHVIEHVPNMVAWLNDLHGLLTTNGIVFLAVPDKRYTFDILRPETSLAHILNDFYRAATVPDLEHIWEHIFLKREVSAIAAWKGDIQSLLDNNGTHWISRILSPGRNSRPKGMSMSTVTSLRGRLSSPCCNNWLQQRSSTIDCRLC